DPSEPQVSDFLHDAVTGLLQPIPTDNPFDILWVRYDCALDSPVTQEPMIVVTMKVSQLAPIPAAANWRMSFAAFAPGGVSDRGEQLYVQANTTNPNSPAFTFGTAVRNSDGSLSYTSRGNAVFGLLDTANSEIVIKVKWSRLDPFLTHGPIRFDTRFYGLRGQTFTNGVNGIIDRTRGGTSF